jgi:hypothetical protein
LRLCEVRGDKRVPMFGQPNYTPWNRHNWPTTIVMLPLHQLHRMHDASLPLQSHVHGCLRGCRVPVASRGVHTRRNFGKRGASFRIAPRPLCEHHHVYSTHTTMGNRRSLTRAASYGSRQSYAFLALPLIFDAFTSKVSYACGAL